MFAHPAHGSVRERRTRQTATAVGVSTGTVSHILERAAAAGLSWPLPDDLDDEGLRARLYPSVARDPGCVQPDWEAVLEELGRKRKRRRTRATRRQLLAGTRRVAKDEPYRRELAPGHNLRDAYNLVGTESAFRRGYRRDTAWMARRRG